MEKLEFSEAVDAYLNHTATSWQEFIVEDYFDCFQYGINILDCISESRIRETHKRLYASISKKIKRI